MVPGAGFEPARPKPGDFKSPAFTHFATRAPAGVYTLVLSSASPERSEPDGTGLEFGNLHVSQSARSRRHARLQRRQDP